MQANQFQHCKPGGYGWETAVASCRSQSDAPWMACIVKLEDGSDICASNMGFSGALASIGEAISDTDARLSRWLVDVSDRVAPFMDFDLRGLNSDHRRSFWLGVQRAHEKCAHWDQQAFYSPSVDVIRQFYERRAVQEVSSLEKVDPVDLDEIWSDYDGT